MGLSFSICCLRFGFHSPSDLSYRRHPSRYLLVMLKTRVVMLVRERVNFTISGF